MKRLGLAILSMLGVAGLTANAYAGVCAYLYENANLGGSSLGIYAGSLSDLGTAGWDNRVSSLKVMKYSSTDWYSVALYGETDYGGNVLVFSAQDGTFTLNSMPSGYDNYISSSICRAGDF